MLIVRTERKLGIRRPIKKGFDIIQNNFFVEEDIVVSCNRCDITLWTLSDRERERAENKRMSRSNPYAFRYFLSL